MLRLSQRKKTTNFNEFKLDSKDVTSEAVKENSDEKKYECPAHAFQ